jgi:hypothetical protein
LSEATYRVSHLANCPDCGMPCSYLFNAGTFGTYMARGCTFCRKSIKTPTDRDHMAGALGFIEDVAEQTCVDPLIVRTILTAAAWCDQFRDGTDSAENIEDTTVNFSLDLNEFGGDLSADLVLDHIKRISDLWIHIANSFYEQPDKRFKDGYRKIPTTSWQRLWIWAGDEYSIDSDGKPDGQICVAKIMVSRHLLLSMAGDFTMPNASRVVFTGDAEYSEDGAENNAPDITDPQCGSGDLSGSQAPVTGSETPPAEGL